MGKWGHQDYFKPVYLFHEKILHAKKCKQKQTNKTKISGTKTTKAAVFCWQKRLRGWKSFVCVWWFLEFFVLFVVFVGAKSFCEKSNRFEMLLMASFTHGTESKAFFAAL